mmetsp:Transcript_3548/g.12489  ORF Transcript_3548/g.12489 Transcript_3548/m.12489 type:complete len:164 (+) Transcript_3548:5702-6193(+)
MRKAGGQEPSVRLFGDVAYEGGLYSPQRGKAYMNNGDEGIEEEIEEYVHAAPSRYSPSEEIDEQLLYYDEVILVGSCDLLMWNAGGGKLGAGSRSPHAEDPDVEDGADKGRVMIIQLFLVEEEEENEKNLYVRLRKQMLYMNKSSRLEGILIDGIVTRMHYLK